jgi:DNA-binding NtrC family response regulator
MQKDKVLVIDDERFSLEFFEALFADEDIEIFKFLSATDALNKIPDIKPSLVICDHLMPEMSGFEVLDIVKKNWPEITFIMITGYGTIERAVEAIKKGAYDYITKPFDNIDDILSRVQKGIENYNLKSRIKILEKNINDIYGISNIIAKSKKMIEIINTVKKIAGINSTVLITGESGTGKELIAKAIHNMSNRKNQRFLEINCSAIPENLQESLFFGYVKGAFTGADTTKKGYFEEANKGTLFLDEIGETSLNLQAKLLRVIQEKKITKVGSVEPVDVDIRLICATNRNLEELVEQKLFRQDLYYRINVINFHIPPLRERKEDIPYLVEFFVKKYSKEFGKQIAKIEPDIFKRFYDYFWPGNVRELENVIERAVALSDRDVLTNDNIILQKESELIADKNDFVKQYDKARAEFERIYLKSLLDTCDGNVLKASKIAKLNPATIHRKISKYLKK